VLARRAARSTWVARLAFAALLLYVAADFANPLMPGAVCFDPDESVDGLARARSSAVMLPVVSAAARTAAAAAPPPVTAHRSTPYPESRAVHAVPRARAALPLLSDRSSDDA
jgi:hypothetical protein